MNELNNKLERLSDIDRAELYRELLSRTGEPSRQSVRELLLVHENTVDAEALRKIASTQLPEHERPTRFIATGKLPRTPHGKLDRRGLPGLIRVEQSAPESDVVSEVTSDELLFSAIQTFRNVLGAVSVGPDSNFFELGGHSLLAVDCILEFQEKTGNQISITQLLNHPTPRGIATLLKAQSREEFDYVYPVSENLSGLPVFVFSASRLAYTLKPKRPDWTIYGIQLRWRDENDEEIQYRDLEDMAAHIVDEIRQLSQGGDFVLAGSSFPAMIAFEVAKQLRASGITPKLTVLIEPSLFAGMRTWIEEDLAYYGRLHANENHLLTWLGMNNPFRAQFWRRLGRLTSSGRSAGSNRAGPSSSRKRQEAYETVRATALRRSYAPSNYGGPALLLVGAERSWQFHRDWEKSLGSSCVVFCLDADHASILKEPVMSEAVVPILMSEVDALSQEDIAFPVAASRPR